MIRFEDLKKELFELRLCDVEEFEPVDRGIGARDVEKFTVSIKGAGVVEPPIFFRTKDGLFDVLSGNKRVAALRLLKSEKAMGYVVPYCDDIFMIPIMENRSHREYNIIETSSLLTRLKNEHGYEDKKLVVEYLPSLGFEKSLKVLNMLLSIGGLDRSLKKYVVASALPLGSSYELSRLSPSEQEAIAAMNSRANLSMSKFREVVTNLCEISLRDGTPIDRILAKEYVRTVLDDEKLSPSEKGERIRNLVHSARNPKTTGLGR